MTKTISILHISDLHRSPGDEVSNAALLSSLLNDKDNYRDSEPKKIQEPDLIIVSGDIIRGSTDPDNSDKEIEEQYKEANDFLNDLCQHFLDGDKDRLVIIPGNHDIDWKYSKESMKKIDSKQVLDDSSLVKSHYLKAAINQHSNIRWSWKDLSFYEIDDLEKYNRRLEAFSRFYSLFYENKKIYSLNPEEQYEIFDYPYFNLTVVAYNSCYRNDHLNFVGDVHPNCIANSNLKLREYKKRGRLILATWHHNIKGPPYEINYMDSSRLKNFIDAGISLGFHGHQHKTEIIHEFSDVVEQKKITVFSAGTLCGGQKELPTGNNRQYNLVEIIWNNEESDLTVILNTREKTETSSFDNPIWKAGRIDSNLISYHAIKITKPKSQGVAANLIEVENLIRDKEYDTAIEELLKFDLQDIFVRKYLAECIIQTERFELALEVFSEPMTDEEMIIVLNAAIELNNRTKMLEIKSAIGNNSLLSPIVKELLGKIEAIIK
ncbi:MAG TPA: metallophosphoesterase [Pyrinomonadaceae bacterium]|jgi:hypothetical protein